MYAGGKYFSDLPQPSQFSEKTLIVVSVSASTLEEICLQIGHLWLPDVLENRLLSTWLVVSNLERLLAEISMPFLNSNLQTTSQSIYFLERLGASSGQVGERSAPGKVQNGAISLSQLIFVPHYGHRVRSVTAFAAVDCVSRQWLL